MISEVGIRKSEILSSEVFCSEVGVRSSEVGSRRSEIRGSILGPAGFSMTTNIEININKGGGRALALTPSAFSLEAFGRHLRGHQVRFSSGVFGL